MTTKKLAEQIKAISKKKKIAVAKVLEDCSINRNFIYDLEHNESFPSIDKIEKIAIKLDVSIDFLIGRTDNPNSHRFNLELLDEKYSNIQIVADDDSVLTASHTIDEEIEYGFKIEDKK